MRKSFTLIEILVVIVVIGILSSFILVGMSSITNSANIAKGKTFASSLRNSLLTNIVSEWKLDETGTDTNSNDSWGTNNGTLANFIFTETNSGWRTGSQCVSGGCLSFDGTNDYINYGNKSDLNTKSQMTFSMWVYPTEETALNPRILGKYEDDNNNYLIHSKGLNGVSFGARVIYNGVDYQNQASMVFDWNKWYHLVVIFNVNSLSFYVDGQLKSNIAGMGGSFSTVTSFYIGTRGGSYFNGLLDEIIIYNQVLSQSKIRNDYFVGINKLNINNGISLEEHNQRMVELKNSLASDNI